MVYNTTLVNGIMQVIDDAELLDLSTEKIIKLVKEKFSIFSVNNFNISDSIKKRTNENI